MPWGLGPLAASFESAGPRDERRAKFYPLRRRRIIGGGVLLAQASAIAVAAGPVKHPTVNGENPKPSYFPTCAMLILVLPASASRVMVTVFIPLLVISVNSAFPSASTILILEPNLSL